VLTSPGRNIPIVVERAGKRVELTVTPERKGREEAGDVGMFPVLPETCGSGFSAELLRRSRRAFNAAMKSWR
jgi:hypothetical protein